MSDGLKSVFGFKAALLVKTPLSLVTGYVHVTPEVTTMDVSISSPPVSQRTYNLLRSFTFVAVAPN